MSTSPSVGHVNGAEGRSQKAGHIPPAHGGLRTAVRQPLCLSNFWWLTRRALVYLSSGADVFTIPRSTSFPSSVKKQLAASAV